MKQRARVLARWMAAAVACFVLGSCRTNPLRPVGKFMSKATGQIGWYRIDPPFGESSPDAGEVAEREQQERYERRFASLALEKEPPCSFLSALRPDSSAPVYVLVHGIYGDGQEWWPVLPVLDSRQPAAMFMLRWSLVGKHSGLIEAITAGVHRIGECFPASKLVILAHSAGGVIASSAAHSFEVDPAPQGPRLFILTVASPLAGTGYRLGDPEPAEDDDSDARLVLQLGASQSGYLAAAPNVQVVHLRTQFPADKVMRPNLRGHAPNQKGVMVAGAHEIDLPAELGHDPSLLHVAHHLADWVR